jgi:hypothetical protein
MLNLILASTDIFVLAPNFQTALVNIHNATMGVAFVVVFAGFLTIVIQAQKERAVSEILPALLRIFMVALFLTFMPQIGNFLGEIVTDIEQESGVNGNPMTAFVAAIKTKFGVDISGMIGSITPGGLGSIATGPAGAPGATKITAYGFQGDLTPDGNSSNAIGNHGNVLTPFGGSQPASAALTASAAAQYNISVGQNFTIVGANNQTYQLNYADTVPSEFNGVSTGNRVDIFDPNGLLSSDDNNFESTVSSESAGANAPATGGGNIGDFANALIHPAETATVAFVGLFTLILSFVAAFVMWIVAVIQSVLYYSEIALAPLFVGFLMVRGLENIAKTFILSFFAIAMWQIAFLIVGLITQLLLGLAVNSGNVGAAGGANVAGMTYLWLIGVSLWVIVGSIVGPMMISRRVVAGASGLAEMLVATHSTAGKVIYTGGSVAASVASAPVAGAAVSNQSQMMMNAGRMPSFARRAGFKEPKGDA